MGSICSISNSTWIKRRKKSIHILLYITLKPKIWHNEKQKKTKLLMRKQQVNTGWGKEKSPPTKRNSFLKRTICKTRSLKPDYRPTMTQSLMFIPVIRCEEADLYFIVVECIEAVLCLFLRLPASLGNIFLLLRPGVIPVWRKQRCL